MAEIYFAQWFTIAEGWNTQALPNSMECFHMQKKREESEKTKAIN